MTSLKQLLKTAGIELKTSELSLEDIFLKLTMGEALPALENTSDKEGND